MAKITLYIDYKSGGAKKYDNARDIAISPAGILTFYWQAEAKGSKGSKEPRAYKFTTSVPYIIEEDAAG